jgi:hypothetical protein
MEVPKNIRTLNVSAALMLSGVLGTSQTPSVKQDAKDASCSNIVALAGNATVNCSSLTPQQRKILEGIPAVLNKILASQLDPDSLMAKLETCVTGVQQVKEQQADWRLSDKQKANLKQMLAGSKAKVQINVIPTDRNASLMGLDLLSTIKDSGWDTSGGLTSDFTLNPALVGVVLVINHGDFPEAVILQKALRAIGIQARGEIDEAKTRVSDATVIQLAIGSKPPVTH